MTTAQRAYSDFEKIISRTRELNPNLMSYMDVVDDYWQHNELPLAVETLIGLFFTWDNIKFNMLMTDVMQSLCILKYLGSPGYSWDSFEKLVDDYNFYDPVV